jgi:hypothetical protein
MQLSEPPSTHVPVPLHESARLSVSPVHDGAAHSVPYGWSLHDLAPLHFPVLWQVETASSGHSLSGSVSGGTGMHIPSLPARLHFSQSPAHPSLQQTPSVQ